MKKENVINFDPHEDTSTVIVFEKSEQKPIFEKWLKMKRSTIEFESSLNEEDLSTQISKLQEEVNIAEIQMKNIIENFSFF